MEILTYNEIKELSDEEKEKLWKDMSAYQMDFLAEDQLKTAEQIAWLFNKTYNQVVYKKRKFSRENYLLYKKYLEENSIENLAKKYNLTVDEFMARVEEELSRR